MSFVSTLKPIGLSFNSPSQSSAPDLSATEIPFYHEPNYLQLQRMLTRYQNLILLVPSSNSPTRVSIYDLTPLQRQIRAELYSPAPYHRTKWLHSIESARNLLLTLERHAQSIKSPRAKKDALKDLAAKRQLIKRLRSRVEEISRDVERLGDKASGAGTDEDADLLGERADAVLAKMGRNPYPEVIEARDSEDLEEGRPLTSMTEESNMDVQDADHDRNALLNPSLRRRAGQGKDVTSTSTAADRGTTSGFSNLGQTERSLQTHAREHEDLTSALVSMAAQLKQQSRAFQFSLTQDESFLNRAVEGLDLNITSMDAASKNMAFLRRMSEEQGWFGRLKLYGIILGLWVAAILLVFVGPKLRF